MNRRDLPALYKDPFARLVVALLKPREGTGGWVRVADLADECAMAKSTVRRHLSALEAGGFPIEHHVDRGVARRNALGIRSLLVGRPRQPDPAPERWQLGCSPAPSKKAGSTDHPWRWKNPSGAGDKQRCDRSSTAVAS